MNNIELISKLQNVVDNYNTVYMWGTFGSPVTEQVIQSKSNQYSDWYTPSKQRLFRSLIGKNYFAFDCVNLIKAMLWGWNGDDTKPYGGAVYASNGVPDVSANGMLKLLIDATDDFSYIEKGEAVWMDGHIGVYIGDGKVIECTPRWDNCVQITACGNIGDIDGLNTRSWVKHGKLPFIDYVEDTETIEGEEQVDIQKIKFRNKENGYEFELDGFVIDGRTFTATRDTLTTYGYNVEWEEPTETIVTSGK